MESSMLFLDGSYSLFAEPAAPPFSYDAESFDFNQVESYIPGLYDFSFDLVSENDQLFNNPPTCNPADIMAPPVSVDFGDFLNDDWSESLIAPTDGPELLVTPDTPAPAHLMTPPSSLPSTPKNAPKTLPVDAPNVGLLTPPPSDRAPRRTRRYNGYEEICRLSQLNLENTKGTDLTVDPTSVFAPAPSAAAAAYIPGTLDLGLDTDMTFSSPSSSEYYSSSSNSSPIDSRSSSTSASSSLLSYLPPLPIQSRSAGVQRVATSTRKARLTDYSQPFPTDDPERPHGCRHPGRLPGDLPCNLDFARKHDWSRHQRVHTGETPYCCRGCDRPFKRPDARGRHWDSRPECEVIHTAIVRELLRTGEMSSDDRDIPVLRRRAQKAECRRESERTGIPVKDLKDMMRNVKHEFDDGPGF